jgi:hypothetical protein
MDYFYLFIAFIVVVSIVSGLTFSSKANKFIKLGNVSGKTLDEIVKVVGKPTSMSSIGSNQVLYQWISVSSSGSYHYAMSFTDGKCIGYTHQSVH